MPVALRIVNDVSFERRINHDIPFAWQAQMFHRYCETTTRQLRYEKPHPKTDIQEHRNGKKTK